MALAPGVRLGVYAITAQIGEGGMGQVYQATDTTLGRQVAIKILPDAFASDPERVARFEREAKTLASLNHPHIAAIYGFEKSAGMQALVMELVEGPTLADRIAQGPISLDEALPIAKQIAEALEAAHENDVIHRDLKPSNIKLTADGKVKILDFGLAKLVAADGRDGASSVAALTMSPTVASPAMMTGVGVILGTAAYMAPEQARGKTVDTRADIWAFGCVLFEMLTGKPPFDGETVTDILAAIVKSEPAWRELPTDTPLSIRSLLRRCLRKAPAERLRHIGDARLEIQDAIAASGTSLEATSRPRSGGRWVAVIPLALASAFGFAVAFFTMETGWRRAAPPMRTTVRLEMNLPTGVELAAGLAQNVAVSSDGQRVAFIGVLGGVRQLYVRRLDQFEAVAVRGTENSAFCFFSPDGLAVGLVSTAGTLRKVSLADGLVVTLASDVDLRGAAWGTNDRITFVHGGALWHMPADGGPPSQLTKLTDRTSELSEAWPTVVAGGRAILFTSVTGRNRGAVHIEALSLDTGLRHVVVDSGSFPLYASSGQLVFFRDGALLAAPFDVQRLEVTGPPARVLSDLPVDQTGAAPQVAMSSAGALVYASSGAASQLVWVSRQGVEQRITDTARSYTSPRLAPDGHRVVVGVNGDLWIHDTARATFTRLTSEQTVGNTFPVWMPNGTRIVFRTRAGLRWIDTDGSGRSQDIPHTLVADYPQSVSPDGRTLLLMRQTPDMSADVEILSLRGDEPPVRPLLRTSAYEGGAQFSPDGRWVAYTSDESGHMEVYVRPFPGPDRKWQVSTQGGRGVLWNPNGKELFYRIGNKTMAVSVSGNAELTFSAPRLLFEQRYAVGSGITAANYDVSPDGERFVMVKDESGSGRLNVVLNWTEELKRLVPTK